MVTYIVVSICAPAISKFPAWRENPVLRVQGMLALSLLVLAFTLGYLYAPAVLRESSRSVVLYEAEEKKTSSVEGQLLFVLSRHVLICEKNKSVFAIPLEKIPTIETPKRPKASLEPPPAPP